MLKGSSENFDRKEKTMQSASRLHQEVNVRVFLTE